ncbi:hypothetical protein ACFQNE_13225 [Gordonia phosphorivorans]|uniref:Uncharacterized protein n=1 Tax=Gordonia phosphorivorans TaxID=1056982 RepID=A0ABV6H3E1_9ACTN
MTAPGSWGDEHGDGEPLPTQAELDAQDMAELAANRGTADLTSLYPRRQSDPGPAPWALARGARYAWYLAAVSAAVCIGYGFATLGSTVERLRARLEPQMAEVTTIDAGASASSMASFWPPALLVGWVIAMGVTYPLLVAIGNHHSRNLRSIYAAVSVLVIMFVPLVTDLLFAYPAVPTAFRVCGWVSAAALVLSVLMTFSGAVGRWLPASTRIKPSRVWRE